MISGLCHLAVDCCERVWIWAKIGILKNKSNVARNWIEPCRSRFRASDEAELTHETVCNQKNNKFTQGNFTSSLRECFMNRGMKAL